MRTLRLAAFAAVGLLSLLGPSHLASAARAADGAGGDPDCDGDGIPDSVEIGQGLATDCNTNGVPDDCDIANGTSADCNGDGLPDECLYCPRVDIVFVMDTSLSMADESTVLCQNITQILTTLHTLGIQTSATILGITTVGAPEYFPCLQGSVLDLLGPTVPGTGGTLNDYEDWGPASAIVADRFGWTPGAIRIVVPLSDEGAEDGNPCEDPGPDRDAIENAIDVALDNGVVVSPIVGTNPDKAASDQMIA